MRGPGYGSAGAAFSGLAARWTEPWLERGRPGVTIRAARAGPPGGQVTGGDAAGPMLPALVVVTEPGGATSLTRHPYSLSVSAVFRGICGRGRSVAQAACVHLR